MTPYAQAFDKRTPRAGAVDQQFESLNAVLSRGDDYSGPKVFRKAIGDTVRKIV